MRRIPAADWFRVRTSAMASLGSTSPSSRNSTAATSGTCADATVTCWSIAAGGGQPAHAYPAGDRAAPRSRGQPHAFRPHRRPPRVRRALGASRRGGVTGQPHPRQHAGRPIRLGRSVRGPTARAIRPITYAEGGAHDAAPGRWRHGHLGNRALEIVHTPGHSPGGIALFEHATGILFSGDIVYDGPLIEDCPGADTGDYVRSMRRLLALPVRVMHGGHFPSCSGERLRMIIKEWLLAPDKAAATL